MKEMFVYDIEILGGNFFCATFINPKTNEKLISMIADFCGQQVEKVAKDCERDYWMSAKESLEYGIVDKVL